MTPLKPMKVLIMAGGTGGHIFPALAVADVLQQKGADIEWLGTQKGLEARLVPEHGYPINYIDIAGLRGKGLKTLLLLPLRLGKAIIQTMNIYKRIQPDVILGMGGFVTGPGGVVGWLYRKPLVLHEQNAIAGLTNKILFKMATKVFSAFPGAFNEHKKLSVIGNPVRKEITDLPEPEMRFKKKWGLSDGSETSSQLNILVVGGSLGATALNERVPQALEMISLTGPLESTDFKTISVRHQCGEKNQAETLINYEWLKDIKQNSVINIEVDVLPFISDMAANYRWADLIVCRSGALTVSEIAAAGVASLLIPFPYAVDDHQTANAAYLADEGAAFLIQQKDLNKERLANVLMTLDKNTIQTMACNARKLAINNAADVVAETCIELAGQ